MTSSGLVDQSGAAFFNAVHEHDERFRAAQAVRRIAVETEPKSRATPAATMLCMTSPDADPTGVCPFEETISSAIGKIDSHFVHLARSRPFSTSSPPQFVPHAKSGRLNRPLLLALALCANANRVHRLLTGLAFENCHTAIPFNNTVEGHRNQTLSTAANSRLGLQIKSTLDGVEYQATPKWKLWT